MKFLKVGRVAIITRGRYAGKKVVLIQPQDSGTKQHPFPHALVVGIERYPKPVTKRMGKKRADKANKLKPFIKVVNYQHLLPTRYNLELEGLKGIISNDTFKETSAREEAKKNAKRILEERYTSGKNRWYFTPLQSNQNVKETENSENFDHDSEEEMRRDMEKAEKAGGIFVCPPPLPREEIERRSQFGDEGCTVYGWPTSRGVIIKENADVVDMEFFGWDRLSPPPERFEDRAQELAFCRLLLKSGAKIYSSLRRYKNSRGTGPRGEEAIDRYFAWPGISTHPDSPYVSAREVEGSEGGVWALQFSEEEVQPNIGKLRMALNMSEKVEIMKELGATFYPDPRSCPGLEQAYEEYPRHTGSKYYPDN